MFFILSNNNLSIFPDEILGEYIYDNLEIECEYKKIDFTNIKSRKNRVNVGEVCTAKVDSYYIINKNIDSNSPLIRLYKESIVYKLNTYDSEEFIQETPVSNLKPGDHILDSSSYLYYLENINNKELSIDFMDKLVKVESVDLEIPTDEYLIEVYLYDDDAVKSIFIDSVMVKNT